jgi:signal transduction histidine kinase
VLTKRDSTLDEQTLRKVSAGMTEAFDAVASALAIFDRKLSVIQRNARSNELLTTGSTIDVLLTPARVPDAGDWKTLVRRVLATGETARFKASPYHLPGARPLRLDLTVSVIREPPGGKVTGGLLIAEDVTAIRQLERQLEELERLAGSGKLVARVAHELNNPLDGVLRYVNMARRSLENAPEKVPDYLEESRKGLMRMIQITGDLLAYSRANRDESEENHVNRIVEEAIRSMQERATELGVVITASYRDESMPSMRGTRLYQVCCNLVKNALDAMPTGGMLTINTGVVAGDVVLHFEDTGPGLPEDVQQIFEPFYSTKPGDEGTGLGLTICKELIQRLGGTIRATSRDEGGAVFTVTFPVEQKKSD